MGQKGYMLCLACETDFVAKNSEFSATANEILDIAIAADAADLEALNAVAADGRTVADKVTGEIGPDRREGGTGLLREDRSSDVRNLHSYEPQAGYVDRVQQGDRDGSRQGRCHAGCGYGSDFDQPGGLRSGGDREHERLIGREQARLDGKPEAMLDKIAEGKVNKFLTENTLLSQPLVKNNKLSVGAYIKQDDPQATVVAYKRFR